MESFEIVRLDSKKSEIATHSLSVEVPLTIVLNGRELATLLCSPSHVRNLVTGFLYTSGLLRRIESVHSLEVDRERWKVLVHMSGEDGDEEMLLRRVYTSGCGKGVLFHNPVDLIGWYPMEDGLRVEKETVLSLMQEFRRLSPEYPLTRGVHSAALAKDGEILFFRDDIGRHNAIDKVVGEALYHKIPFNQCLLLTSGRISSEILSKALRCRMPIIAAAGSPTNQAVLMAKQMNFTLLGRVRGSRMNVYSGEGRILEDGNPLLIPSGSV